jgi:hypothetical protein
MTKYANHYGYSDVNPFEVVRVISDKTIEVREMDAERDDSVKMDFHVGGFFAHCSNQRDQKWFIKSDETAPVVRIRLGKNGWKDFKEKPYEQDSRTSRQAHGRRAG